MKLYHYTESGLRNVYLRNGYTLHKTPYGPGVSFNGLEDLHRVLALTLVTKAGKLSGTEIRFLRKEMEMAQTALASLLGVSAQTLADWEKGKAKISRPADKLLRVAVRGHYSGNVTVRRMIDMLNSLDVDAHESRMIFQEEGRGWKVARSQSPAKSE